MLVDLPRIAVLCYDNLLTTNHNVSDDIGQHTQVFCHTDTFAETDVITYI